MPTTPLTSQLLICPCPQNSPTVCLPGQAVIGPGTSLEQVLFVPPGKVVELIAWNIPTGGRVSASLFDGAECQSGLSFPFFPCGTADISLTPINRTMYLGAGTYKLTAAGSAADYLIKPAIAMLVMSAKELRDLQCACSCPSAPALPPNCPFTFTATNLTITTVGEFHVLTLTGPAGATFTLDIAGIVNSAPVDVQQAQTIPVGGLWTFNTGASVAGDHADFTFTVTPTGANLGAVVCGGPYTVHTDVPAGSCDFTFTATNLTITGPGQFHVLTLTGPAGATFTLDIAGQINNSTVDVHQPQTIPSNGVWTFNTGASVAGDDAVFTFGVTPTGANQGATVCGGPFAVNTAVP